MFQKKFVPGHSRKKTTKTHTAILYQNEVNNTKSKQHNALKTQIKSLDLSIYYLNIIKSKQSKEFPKP